MNLQEAMTLFRYYQQSHHRKRTIDSYQALVGTFEKAYGNRSLESLQPDEIYQFLEKYLRTVSQINEKVTLCPAEGVLQLHHRQVSPRHEEPLRHISSLEDLPDATASAQDNPGQGNGG